MKKNWLKFIIAAFLVSIATCIFAANKKEDAKVIHISYEEFNKKVININANDFKYLGDKPCILDFYATWCGPCKMVSPHLDALAKEYGDQIYIYKIDVDKDRELGRAFGATSIPLIIFIPTNDVPQAARGYMSKEELKNAIETVLLKK